MIAVIDDIPKDKKPCHEHIVWGCLQELYRKIKWGISSTDNNSSDRDQCSGILISLLTPNNKL
jgi:hypothetical protein